MTRTTLSEHLRHDGPSGQVAGPGRTIDPGVESVIDLYDDEKIVSLSADMQKLGSYVVWICREEPENRQ